MNQVREVLELCWMTCWQGYVQTFAYRYLYGLLGHSCNLETLLMIDQGKILLEETIGQLLLGRMWTLATAESCTGGGIGNRITSISGSSAYYLGGIIAYHNTVKQNCRCQTKDHEFSLTQ